MGPPAPALSRGWALLAVAQCSSVSPRPPLANLSFITIFEIWIISSLIRMIKWWFLKILCPERKKWTSNYSKICLYDCQYSHKRTSVCVETVCVKWYPQSPPEMQGGLALKSLWVQADPRGSTWMLIRLHGKGPLFDRALSQAAVGTGGILFVKAERQYPWGHHRAWFLCIILGGLGDAHVAHIVCQCLGCLQSLSNAFFYVPCESLSWGGNNASLSSISSLFSWPSLTLPSLLVIYTSSKCNS